MSAIQVVCPYCHEQPEFLADSSHIYHGRNFGPLWYCKPCQAWVGCHKGTRTPLGRLADAPLRKAKAQAHAAFDPLWRRGILSRSSAYAFLASQLGISGSVCHIGYFDIETCKRVIEVCHGLADQPAAVIKRHMERHQGEQAHADSD